MPRGDRTGPLGQGPRTGRGAGLCSGYDVPGYMNWPRRGFFGRGRGLGRGFGWRAQANWAPAYPAYAEQAPAPTKEEEKQALESELKEIEAEKAEIEKRLKELG